MEKQDNQLTKDFNEFISSSGEDNKIEILGEFLTELANVLMDSDNVESSLEY